MYVTAALFGFSFSISENFYFSWNRPYNMCRQLHRTLLTPFTRWSLYKSAPPPRNHKGHLLFAPSLLSVTYAQFGIYLLPLDWGTPVKWRYCHLFAQPSCLSGCHSHILPETACWYQLSFILPTRWPCGWNSLFGTNQGITAHYKSLVYFSWHLPRVLTQVYKSGWKQHSTVCNFNPSIYHPSSPSQGSRQSPAS